MRAGFRQIQVLPEEAFAHQDVRIGRDVDESMVAKPLHELTYSRARGAHHLRQLLVGDFLLQNAGFGCAEFPEQPQ